MRNEATRGFSALIAGLAVLGYMFYRGSAMSLTEGFGVLLAALVLRYVTELMLQR